MSGLPDSRKDAADLIAEDKRLMEELVTNVCFHLISNKELNVPEEENSRGTADQICLKQKRESTIKELIAKFFENREKACNSFNNGKNCESNATEANVIEKKDDAGTEIFKENITEMNIPTGKVIDDIAPQIQISDSDNKEINTLHTVTEGKESLENKKYLESVCEEEADKIGMGDTNEKIVVVGDVNDNSIFKIESPGEIENEIKTLHIVTEEEKSSESKKYLESVHEGEAKIEIGIEDANEKIVVVGDVNDNFILKIESPGEIESEINHIGLTPEEEEEIKSLILLAESNYREEVSIKTEIKDDNISDCITTTKSEVNDYKTTGECKEYLKSVSDVVDDAATICKHDGKETLEGPETKMNKNQSTHISLPPMCDMRSNFYIDQNMIPVKYYQQQLVSKRWTPTQVLYELCCQCNWPTPDFRLIEFSHEEGFWYSVKVNNHNFVSYKKARTKSGAKHLASARCLKFLGFKFSYEIFKKSERPSSSAISPWCERYSNYNSISLSREEERRGEFRYSKRSRENKTDIDNFRYYKRRRSSSNESRHSKILRAFSPEIRRDILKRKRRIDEKVVRLKSRRDISPEMCHRRPLLRMDQEAKRRARLVHERIAVTHIYDCKTSHSSRSRDV